LALPAQVLVVSSQDSFLLEGEAVAAVEEAVDASFVAVWEVAEEDVVSCYGEPPVLPWPFCEELLQELPYSHHLLYYQLFLLLVVAFHLDACPQ
jgi:hypothetical protein